MRGSEGVHAHLVAGSTKGIGGACGVQGLAVISESESSKEYSEH